MQVCASTYFSTMLKTIFVSVDRTSLIDYFIGELIQLVFYSFA